MGTAMYTILLSKSYNIQPSKVIQAVALHTLEKVKATGKVDNHDVEDGGP